ncbi:methylmalonyl Co-A mutase-associated GTPase MeaB [Litoribacter ruber]|uniref:methylmalonyl Co-A mutase-associated GTPase MeaB n=1 Tax=Litoribacter ruber TaxID=702568 RepID=UPI001BDA23C2|nr:methylmalonyl Co-A mutase-associated GTPase MeaB [Litoribacter ruber]MBT0811903.1 methylmalonyl Co-A mutase-associated GTPase MeaB [Litoribacter ruber]
MVKRKNRLSVEEYVEGILAGNRVVLSRAITLVESSLASDQHLAEEVVNRIMPHTGNSLRIGITGVPGVGKSTFIESFGKLVVDQGNKLAVLAIDPSSQKTKGSILGDKTRMEELSHNSNAFIRPTPAGAALGGVSAKTRESMLLCEAAGFNVIFIETVGVGQSEIMVKGMVDFFLLLMLSGAGDELQGIKKGIIEIADAIAITKADGDNIEASKKAKREYNNALHLFPLNDNGWRPQVKICSAVSKDGLADIWAMVQEYKTAMQANGFFEENRSNQRVNWFDEHVRYLLESRFFQQKEVKAGLIDMLPKIKNGEMSSISVARYLVDYFLKDIPND